MRVELPTLIVVTLGVGALMVDGELSRLDGILMALALVIILVQMIRTQSKDETLLEEAVDEPLPNLNPTKAWLTFVIGLILLIASSRLLVWGATDIALRLGVSQLVIGLTIVAVGTSLPELAATVASALRGHTEIAVGNVIGSNLFNLLAVMPIPALFSPMPLSPEVLTRDYAMMCLATLMLAAAILVGRMRKAAPAGHSYVGRSVGALLVTFYVVYYYLLYITI
jgi:cation:H+ antiporter